MSEPTDEQWEASVADYRSAGWQDDPGDWERMFWEAGFKLGSKALSEHDRQVAERAWDECEESAYYDPETRDLVSHSDNPYRKEQS